MSEPASLIFTADVESIDEVALLGTPAACATGRIPALRVPAPVVS